MSIKENQRAHCMTVVVGLVGSQINVNFLQSVDDPTVAGNLERKSRVFSVVLKKSHILPYSYFAPIKGISESCSLRLCTNC